VVVRGRCPWTSLECLRWLVVNGATPKCHAACLFLNWTQSPSLKLKRSCYLHGTTTSRRPTSHGTETERTRTALSSLSRKYECGLSGHAYHIQYCNVFNLASRAPTASSPTRLSYPRHLPMDQRLAHHPLERRAQHRGHVFPTGGR
jgi:hypothetical protein